MLQYGYGLGIANALFGGAYVAQDSVPANIVPPTLTGPTIVGRELSCSQGAWAGHPTPAFTYQWRKDGLDIAGATTNVHTVIASDVGFTLTCAVTATNTMGDDTTLSNAVAIEGTVGAEIVVNGDFAAGQANWEWPIGSGSVDTNGGVLGISATNTCFIDQVIPTTVGQRYIYSVEIVSASGSGYKGILKADDTPPVTRVAELRNGQLEGAGTSIGEFIATAISTHIIVEVAAGNSMSVDNISVKHRIMP